MLYLPRYSLEFNPVDPARLGVAGCWSLVKARLRSADARTREALLAAVAGAQSGARSSR